MTGLHSSTFCDMVPPLRNLKGVTMIKYLGFSAVVVLLAACSTDPTPTPTSTPTSTGLPTATAPNTTVLPVAPNHLWVKTAPKAMVQHIKNAYGVCQRGTTHQIAATPVPDGSIMLQVVTTEPIVPNTMTIVPQNGGSDIRFTGLDSYSMSTLDILANWSVGKYVCK